MSKWPGNEDESEGNHQIVMSFSTPVVGLFQKGDQKGVVTGTAAAPPP